MRDSGSARQRTRRGALGALLCAPLAALAQPQRPGQASTASPELPAAVRSRLLASGLPLEAFGLCVRDVEHRMPTLALNAESPYVLASTAKIVTSLAAIDLLGPHYRWRTHAFAVGPVEQGRLRGNLVIVGGGDPLLSTSALRSWLHEIRARGLQDIGGDILVDRGAFGLSEADHRSTPWPASDRPHHVRPDAFTVDEGVLQVSVKASAAPVRTSRGQAADTRAVDLQPPLSGLRLLNRVQPGSDCRLELSWAHDRGEAQLQIDGQWAAACGTQTLATVPPVGSDFALRAVAALWAELGGKLAGRVRQGHVAGRQGEARLPLYGPDGAPIFPWATLVSAPLDEVVRRVNKSSHNLAARHLLLSLSRGFPGRAATLDGARQSVQAWLLRQGLAPGDFDIDSGSGLSRLERGKPRALAQLLCAAWHSPRSQSFIESLPLAGVDGTLVHRFTEGAASARAHLKTGTLLDARALAGFVRARSGRVLALVAIANHPDAAMARPALDGLVEWVAQTG